MSGASGDGQRGDSLRASLSRLLLPLCSVVHCRCCIRALQGVEHGVSQIARRSSGGTSDTLTWNYPLDIMFRSSNVHGWPQLVLGVYGLTAFGGDVVRGYAFTHVPTTPGRHTRYVQLYTPVSSSWCQRLTAWITNNPPEFFDSKFVAQGKGREVTRVRSHGCVKVTFNVTTKNMQEWGYQMSSERALAPGAGGADGPPPAQMFLQQQGSYGDNAGLSRQPSGYGGGLSARGNGDGSARGGSAVPPKTQLSASTTAGLLRQRSQAQAQAQTQQGGLINPPSQAGSRENSRRDLLTGGGGGSGDEAESKYPQPASNLSQRPSPVLRPASELQPLQGGGQLAPLRSGGRPQLNPL